MKKIKADRKTEKSDLVKHLNRVDKLFVSLEKDKTLPTFVEHVALCIMLGTSEKVNLKTMYPKVHSKLTKFVLFHEDNNI